PDAGLCTAVHLAAFVVTSNTAHRALHAFPTRRSSDLGTTAAALTGFAAASAFGSDLVSVIGTGAGIFANKNAGINNAVTVTGYSVPGTNPLNYNLVQPAGSAATINKANLAVTGISASD